jgi:hypothetical protein
LKALPYLLPCFWGTIWLLGRHIFIKLKVGQHSIAHTMF